MFRRRRVVAVGIAIALLLVAVVAGALLTGGDDDQEQPEAHPTLPAFVDGEAKRALAPVFERAAHREHLPVALLMALGWRESRWRAEALNPESGATGIGQLLPATATFVAENLLADPSLDPANGPDNIRMTARYLRGLIERFDGSTRLGLAAYLQGSTSVADSGVSATTDAYLRNIAGIRRRFEAARRGAAGSATDPLAS
jgi:soluble lytic murein transglycosylase-like protein